MNRLTTTKKLEPELFKNLKDIDENKYFLKVDGKSYEDTIEIVTDKLGELEDIEDELGIDLVTILTALTTGYVFWKYDNFIYKVQVESITNCCLKVNTWYYVSSNKNGKRYGDEFTISFKDYGKTWALTREELER